MRQIALYLPVRELLSGSSSLAKISGFLSSFSFAAGLFLISDSAYALQDITQILSNISRVFAPLTLLVLMISYVAGIFFIFRALMLFKKFGSGQTQGEIGQPLLYLFVGTVLIFLPTTTDVTMNSLFGQTRSIFSGGVNYGALGTGSSLMSYGNTSGIGQQWSSLANTLVLYMQFLGFLSFVRGWFIIAKSSTPNQQGGGIAKGLTHIIGGIALVNIVTVMNILSNTIWGS
jgi:intracellular multiplication protein IcmC